MGHGAEVTEGVEPEATEGAEPEVGIEPTTYRLQGGCSTTELLRRTAAHARLPRSYASDDAALAG